MINWAVAADQVIPLKAPPLPFNPISPPWSYGVMLGGDFAGRTGVNSTSGFYQGGYRDLAGVYGGLFANIPFEATGPRAVPLQSWIWSFNPVIDFMHAGGIKYNGTGGGFPSTGSGSLSQFDLLLMLKATTPLTATSSLAIYGGLGGAVLSPRGNPTGAGGPAYTGSSVVPAFRTGVEWSQRVNPWLAVALQGFYQHTGGATFDTSLPGERFEVKDSDSVMLGLTFNFGDNTPPAGPRPGGPVIAQDTSAKPATTTTTTKAVRHTFIECGIKNANCGAYIWRPQEGGTVSDAQRIAIYKTQYKAATKARLCDVIFYNDDANLANDHVEFVTAVAADGAVLQTLGQNSDNGPVSLGPPKPGGQVMTRDPPPADNPTDGDITNALSKIKDKTKLGNWDEFLKLCRQRNKVDFSTLK